MSQPAPRSLDVETNASADARRMLSDAVGAFVARKTTLNRVRGLRATEPGFDRALWREMADLGWLGILVPERYGGLVDRVAFNAPYPAEPPMWARVLAGFRAI